MEGHQILKRLKTFLISPENRPKIFYLLAFAPLVAIVYFHFEYPSATVMPFYGFLLLALKKHNLFSHNEAKVIQKPFGLLLIIAGPFVHITLLPFFPWAIYYGAANYALHILGLFLFFFDISTLKEAFAPMFLIVVPSAGSTVSRWAELYFKPFLPFFTILVVAVINAMGIKAVISESYSNSFVLYTPHGSVSYGISWACIGFEGAFLFAIVLVILLFEESAGKKTKILWSAVGLFGTLLLNIFRLVLIFVTEYVFGRGVSTTVHYSMGYVLFIVWITAFLYLFSKREAIQGKIKLAWQKLSLSIRKVP